MAQYPFDAAMAVPQPDWEVYIKAIAQDALSGAVAGAPRRDARQAVERRVPKGSRPSPRTSSSYPSRVANPVQLCPAPTT